MSDNKKDLKKKLAKYGMFAAAIAGANEADAAVVYTDEVPDFAGAIGSQYFLDLNNDGNDDFRIWHNGSSNLYISPLTSVNEALGSGGATFAYPFALSSGAAISSGAGAWFNNGFAGGFQSLNYGSCSFGNWCSVTDGYIGLRFDISGSIHYGWVRLDVNQAGSVWSVKDYAYETTAGVAINAGDNGTGGSVAAPASAIIGADIAENSNGLDLQVDFTASLDETTIAEYRVIVVKSSLVGIFDQVAAEALTVPNYTAVAPTGAPSYTEVFNAASVDSDGDLLVIGQPYRIYILNMADGVNATINSFTGAANDVTLNTTADIALSIVGSDVNDNADASDLQADFDAAANEAGISEYRVIAVKSASAASFNLGMAQGLGVTAYESVAPGAGPYSVVFNSGTTDSDGDAIVLAQPYTLFVLSVADGTVANIGALNMSATDVTLNVTTEMANTIYGTDIADNANGLDLQVNFLPPSNEQGILAYRVIAVKSSAAGSFTLNDGLTLPSTAWMFVTATGAPFYEVVFESNKTDSDGDLITENQPYTLFVISFANSVQATASSMASSTNDITLISYIGLDEVSLETISAYNNGNDIIIETPTELLGNKVEATLVNLQGQVVKTLDITDSITKVNTDKFVTGMYFLNFKNTDGTMRTVKIHL